MKDDKISIMWGEREVENPILRFLVGTTAMLGAMLGLLMAMLAFVLIPVTLPLHVLLKALGLRGFTEISEDGSMSYKIDRNAFRKA